MRQVTFRFQKGDSVGDIDAELDRSLDEDYVDTGDLAILRSIANPRSVVVGRTGSGKTALLKQLEKKSERVIRIHPGHLSLQYLTNSTIIPELVKMGVHLEPFYQLLWRHVLVMELIRNRFELREDSGRRGFLQRLGDRISINRAEKKALEYYTEWNPTFWENSDVRVQEITKKLRDKMSATLGAEFGARATAAEEQEESEESRQVLTKRAQAVVREVSLENINTGMEILRKHVLDDDQKPYFIVIDDLDKDWVDTEYAYDLITSLLDAAGDFAKLPNVKVIVALRENIVEAIQARRKRQTQQREKYESIFHRLRWSETDLLRMIDTRLARTIKGFYGGPVKLETLLPESNRKKRPEDPIRYVLDRTLKRPRDLIDFVNRCLSTAAAAGSNRITWQILRAAERDYSNGRLSSLEDEWFDAYPDIGIVFSALKGAPSQFTLDDLGDDRAMNIVVRDSSALDPSSIVKQSARLFEREGNAGDVWRFLVPILVRVALIGAKYTTAESYLYSYDRPDIVNRAIDSSTRFCVHPAFVTALESRSIS